MTQAEQGIVLKSMGYREVEPGKWAKPVGYLIFIFAMDKQMWLYYSGHKEGALSKAEYNIQGDFLNFIKYREACTCLQVFCTTEYEFLLPEQAET